MKKLTAFLLGAVVLTCSSCGSNGSSSNNNGGGGGGTGAIAVTASGPTAVAGGSAATFTASVVNTSNTAVTWQVNGTVGGNSTIGTISAVGSYTAPNLPPSGGSVTITAVSQADSTKSGSITVTIQFSNANIQGEYTFSVSGSTGAGGVYPFIAAAGTLQANGSGLITNGVEDLNGYSNNSPVAFTGVAFTGSYSVGADGRGSATINSSLGTTVYRFVVLASGQVQLIGFDQGDEIKGFALPQASNSLSLSALAGNWSFFLSDVTGETVIAGRFTLDSSGNITLGEEDQNLGGTVSSAATFTGTASGVSGDGRGTASFTGTLGTSNFAFYVNSANTVEFVDIDSGVSPLIGSAYKQQDAAFTNSSLSGTYVFLLAGGSANAAAKIGEITANGNGLFTGGVFDENANGTAVLNQAITGGSYSVATNGRGTASVSSAGGTSTFTFYLVSQSLAVFVETDSFVAIEGLANLQSGAPFSNSSLSGSFGFTSSGIYGIVFESGGGEAFSTTEDVGQMTASGSGSLTAGVEDITQAFGVFPNNPLSGTYSFASNGRGTAQLTGGGLSGAGGPSNLILYIVNPSIVDYLEIDPSEVIAGFTAKQF